MKTLDDCSAEEALNFLHLYFATVDLLIDAQEKYQRLAKESTTVSGRSEFRARALEAERDLELMKNQRRSFMNDELGIRPPTVEVVQNTRELAAELAKIVAKDAKATAIVDIATQGLDAFNQVTAA